MSGFYLVSGKLGSGKTLISVARIRDALQAGRRVATNLDLHFGHFLRPRARAVDCVRLPDQPSVSDLELIGVGNAEMDETKNGLLVLDEMSHVMNARSWNEPGRKEVLEWLSHSRKLGWDVMFICQHPEQLDKQARESYVEYHVSCRRTDKISIPIFGGLIRFFSGGWLSGRLPKMHFGVMRYGMNADSPRAETWLYLARDLWPAYNTRQLFRADYPHGVFSYLTPWHLKGRYMPTFMDRVLRWWNPPKKRPALKPKLPLAALLGKMDPDDAVRHWRRLDALGAF